MPTKRASTREELKRQIRGRAMGRNHVMAPTPRTPTIRPTSKSPGKKDRVSTAAGISADIRRSWKAAQPVKIGQKRK